MADILNDAISAIQTMRSEAMTAYDKLESIAQLPFLSWFDFSALPGFQPESPGKIELGTALPLLEKASVPLLDALGPETLERYRAHIWQGVNLDSMQGKIMQWIENGGVGISPELQDAIFDQGRERDLRTLKDEMDMAGARTGARGFRYPNSMTRTLQNQALARYSDKKADLSREIIKVIADLAQKNVQFAMAQDVDIEKLHADFAIRYADLYRNINKDILDRFRVEQEARIVEFEGKLKTLGLDIEIQLKNATLSMEHQQQLLETWKTQVSILTERGKAQIEQSKQASAVKLSAASKIAEVYSRTIQGLTGSAIKVETSKK
jgi:hypothetical protein